MTADLAHRVTISFSYDNLCIPPIVNPATAVLKDRKKLSGKRALPGLDIILLAKNLASKPIPADANATSGSKNAVTFS